MKQEQHKKMFFNRAETQNFEKISCANCGESLIFAMRDKNGNEFSIGLSIILQCLKQAENEQCVPKIPNEWWINVINNNEVSL